MAAPDPRPFLPGVLPGQEQSTVDTMRAAAAVPWYGPVLMVLVVVFVASLFGIWTRPVGFLANVWPANALLLGVLLRTPGAAHPMGWVAAALAFVCADLLTGSDMFKALVLNGANLVSVGTAYLVLAHLPEDVIRLRQPVAMLHLTLATALGGALAGVVGGVVNPLLFSGTFAAGFVFWWITELVNYVAILPLVLSAPPLRSISSRLSSGWSLRKVDLLPALAVLFSCAAAILTGGPGAIAFPILALLWCGLAYPVFLTAVLTLLYTIFALVVISSGYSTSGAQGESAFPLFSIRLGAAVIAIAPIMVAIVMRNRNELLEQMRYLVTHDVLTGVGSRAAFIAQAERDLSACAGDCAVLMIDLDHFKSINDACGHATGDEVLRVMAKRIRGCLRPTDRLGRMGGEEFAVLLSNCTPQVAREIADRIRTVVAATPVSIDSDRKVKVTTSVGLATCSNGMWVGLDKLLAEADAALYQGKREGRNKVVEAG